MSHHDGIVNGQHVGHWNVAALRSLYTVEVPDPLLRQHPSFRVRQWHRLGDPLGVLAGWLGLVQILTLAFRVGPVVLAVVLVRGGQFTRLL